MLAAGTRLRTYQPRGAHHSEGHIMTITQQLFSTTTGAYLKVGDILKDDIWCRVISITWRDYDETCVTVQDGNGYHYQIRYSNDAKIWLLNWDDETWAQYLAL